MRFKAGKSARVAAVTLLSMAFGIGGAMAQGFPGGGGKGRGGMRPSGGTSRPSPAAEQQQPANPLATFLGGLGALRMELLVREDQADAWTTMRDALRAYVDLEPQSNAHTASIAVDPLQRIRNLEDDTRTRADALKKVGDSIGALAAILDERQRETFGQRLANAFAAGDSPTR